METINVSGGAASTIVILCKKKKGSDTVDVQRKVSQAKSSVALLLARLSKESSSDHPVSIRSQRNAVNTRFVLHSASNLAKISFSAQYENSTYFPFECADCLPLTHYLE